MKYISVLFFLFSLALSANEKPNIILVMADDQGWGQMGYMNHPLLKTPNFNAMAANGLRFNRFYASAPVCSPTRASVLTGRVSDRTGVFGHGYALRREELSLAKILNNAGYATAHFGKWHLDGLRGPGVPVLADDPHSPGKFGFDEWLTMTNFFDMNPLMGRKGKFEEFKGDSSEIIVAEAIKFIEKKKDGPFLAVIWYGSPHNPFHASEEDQAPFKSALKSELGIKHHAEIRAMDRSIGTLRKALRDNGIAENTLLWYTSDNGGLKNKETEIDSVGCLKGNKSTMWEGGLRVPGIIEWPAVLKPRETEYVAGCIDILPTLIDLLDLKVDGPKMDGISLKGLFDSKQDSRPAPLPFHYAKNKSALIGQKYKMLHTVGKQEYELFDLEADPIESKNIYSEIPELGKKMATAIKAFEKSVKKSYEGGDYPNGIQHQRTERKFWTESEHYKKYFEGFFKRPEYALMKKRYLSILKNKSVKIK